MKTVSKNVEGRYYPEFHLGWGGCAEELFHYTSRYASCTESFLRNLADQRQFSMSGYQATQLSESQRRLMAAILSAPPNMESARDITAIIRSVISKNPDISQEMADRYKEYLKIIPDGVVLVYAERKHAPIMNHVAPLDPFLNLATRLHLPVAVHDRYVEVSLKKLAEHLDSPNATLRSNLLDAILRVHTAGYLIKNHPGLTHKRAKIIGDEDAV